MIIFIGISGNTMVIVVVTVNRQMRNSTNALIVNLAAADLLFLTFCVPFAAADFIQTNGYPYSNWWCSCFYYLQFVTAYVSVWTLVLMSFDRFLAVVFPAVHLLTSLRNAILASALLWIIILAGNANQLWKHNVFEIEIGADEKRRQCGFVHMANASGTQYDIRIHFLTFTALGYVTPLLVTCCLYLLIIHKLWLWMPSDQAVKSSKSHFSCESLCAKRKVTRMVSGVIVCFAVCLLPLNGCFVYAALNYEQHEGAPYSKTFLIVMVCSQSLAYTNSCLNPILYAFLSENFRKGIFHIIRCCSLFHKSNATGLTNGSTRRQLADCDMEKTDDCTLNNSSLLTKAPNNLVNSHVLLNRRGTKGDDNGGKITHDPKLGSMSLTSGRRIVVSSIKSNTAKDKFCSCPCIDVMSIGKKSINESHGHHNNNYSKHEKKFCNNCRPEKKHSVMNDEQFSENDPML